MVEEKNSSENKTLHFRDYWRVVRARKEIILAIALLIVIVGSVYTFTLPNIFQSSALMKVNNESPDVDVFGPQSSGMAYNPYFLRTQFKIIQSRPILTEVCRRLNLQKVWSNENEPNLPEEVALKILRQSVSVVQDRDTSLIRIILQRQNAEEAARIANKIVEVYRDTRRDIKMAEMRDAVDALDRQMDKQQEKVNLAEENLEKIRQNLDVNLLSQDVSVDNLKLQQLEADRISAKIEMLTKKARLEQLTDLSEGELVAASDYVVQDVFLSDLRNRVTENELLLTQLSQNYGKKHPEVVRARAKHEKLLKQREDAIAGLRKGIRAVYEVDKARYESINTELTRVQAANKVTHREKLLPFNKAKRELEIQRSILDALKARLAQEGVTMEIPRTQVELVESAQPGARPVSPNWFLNIIIAIVLGLGSGVGLAYFIEYLDDSVKTAEDIEHYLDSSVLGLIPQNVRPLTEEGPESEHAESYRVLRTNLGTLGGSGCKSYVCTSGGAGEGKSTTIFNLAYVCAQNGDRVLLIDADMRRPVQHKILEMSNRFGLANVFLRDVPIEEAIKPTSIANLDFLPSGRLPRSLQGGWDSRRIEELVAGLRHKYDLILFDSPPVIGLSDAVILGKAVDYVLQVCQYRKFPRDMAVRAKQTLESGNASIAGVVLNNINVVRDDYYYYYHSYYYNYYHSQEDTTE